MKLILCMVLVITTLMITLTTGRGHIRGRNFQDSFELRELDIDERPLSGRGHRHRNHRGRGMSHHHNHDRLAPFEEGLPALYPIKGPVQPPLILHSHLNRRLVLQQHQNNAPVTQNLPQQLPPLQQPQSNGNKGFEWQQNQNNAPVTNTFPHQLPPLQQPQSNTAGLEWQQNQPLQQPQTNTYEVNPFLFKIQTPSEVPTNTISPSVSNQLPISDKPITTTTTQNPRLTDLLYGSNLFEEDDFNSRG
ncbi:hypothetical protein FF38_01665 [Lucilia cuprina]|uniref:Uncharacterized protein n=1 Tax=Lucilia cuprina TaxID=7375 RepID=A0A0L0BRR8_LUCCU|nr:hypothetical protein CVS40_4608 [Lucilia cuprina]KNC22693.1 hypothetical protein FF38_01665 [Lucilia cuprina]